MKCFWFIFLVLIRSTELCAASKALTQLSQSAAKINYCNTKYVRGCYALTRRIRRGEPYKSNYTMKILQTWNNNVTLRIVMVQEGLPLEIVKTKVCDGISINWLYEFFKLHSTVEIACPLKPGDYALINVEFPPKNIPQSILKLLSSQFYAKFYFQTTKTEEIITECTIDFIYRQ